MILYPEVFLYSDNSINLKSISLYRGDQYSKTVFDTMKLPQLGKTVVIKKFKVNKLSRIPSMQRKLDMHMSLAKKKDIFVYAEDSGKIFFLEYKRKSEQYAHYTLFNEQREAVTGTKAVKEMLSRLQGMNARQIYFPLFIGVDR